MAIGLPLRRSVSAALVLAAFGLAYIREGLAERHLETDRLKSLPIIRAGFAVLIDALRYGVQ